MEPEMACRPGQLSYGSEYEVDDIHSHRHSPCPQALSSSIFLGTYLTFELSGKRPPNSC